VLARNLIIFKSLLKLVAKRSGNPNRFSNNRYKHDALTYLNYAAHYHDPFVPNFFFSPFGKLAKAESIGNMIRRSEGHCRTNFQTILTAGTPALKLKHSFSKTPRGEQPTPLPMIPFERLFHAKYQERYQVAKKPSSFLTIPQ